MYKGQVILYLNPIVELRENFFLIEINTKLLNL